MYTINFLDNRAVLAADLNAIAQSLGGDASAFLDDTLYGVDDLNAISESLITPGVTEGCLLEIEDGSVLIGEGTLFLPGGGKVSIDGEGIVLPFAAGVENFVYFALDEQTGFAVPCCTDFEPEGENHVMLGTVTETGQLSGYPDRAVMKNPYLGKNFSESYSIKLYYDGEKTESLLSEIPLTDVGATKLMVSAKEPVAGIFYYRDNYFSGQVDLETGDAWGVLATVRSEEDSEALYTLSHNQEGILTAALCRFGSTRLHHKMNLRFVLGTDKVLRIYRSYEQLGISGAENLRSDITLDLVLC